MLLNTILYQAVFDIYNITELLKIDHTIHSVFLDLTETCFKSKLKLFYYMLEVQFEEKQVAEPISKCMIKLREINLFQSIYFYRTDKNS